MILFLVITTKGKVKPECINIVMGKPRSDVHFRLTLIK